MKVMIIGSSSAISRRLAEQLHAAGHQVTQVGRQGPDLRFDADRPSDEAIAALLHEPQDAYVLNLGVMYPARINQQSMAQIEHSMQVNLLTPVRICEAVFALDRPAKVLLLGSESASKGSFDTSYFLAKAALQAYVRERYLHHPQQQLLLLSPSTIADAGMTTRRADSDRLAAYQAAHPKQRFLQSAEVAQVMVRLLSDEFNYLNNAEIELNGGKFARMR